MRMRLSNESRLCGETPIHMARSVPPLQTEENVDRESCRVEELILLKPFQISDFCKILGTRG